MRYDRCSCTRMKFGFEVLSCFGTATLFCGTSMDGKDTLKFSGYSSKKSQPIRRHKIGELFPIQASHFKIADLEIGKVGVGAEMPRALYSLLPGWHDAAISSLSAVNAPCGGWTANAH